MTRVKCNQCGRELLSISKSPRKTYLCEVDAVEVITTFGILYRGYPTHSCEAKEKVTPGMQWFHNPQEDRKDTPT